MRTDYPHPHYELLETCGQGGMGVVYRARDRRLNRIVALKFLVAQVGSTRDEALGRFQREAEAIAALSHPHIATIYEIGTWDGEPFLALEYLSGGTLKDRIRAGRLSAESLLLYARQLGAALRHAHDRGIWHRDIKPSNAMFSAEGDLKLVDFGLAKWGGSTDLTVTGALVGTYAYMAPELFAGDEAGPLTDQYAFGALLWEMATGEKPVAGHTAEERSRTLHQRVPALPSAYCEACGRALAVDSQERFPSMAELLRHLGGSATGVLVAPDSPTVTERGARRALSGKVPQRTVRRVAAAAGLLLAVAGGMVGLVPSLREKVFGARGSEAKDPRVQALYQQGLDALRTRNRPEEAITKLKQAVQMDPAFARAGAALAESYLRLYEATRSGEWLALADQAADEAAKQRRDPEVLIALGLIRKATGRPDSAISLYQEAIQKDPAQVEAYRLLGATYQSLGRTAEAEATFKDAIRAKPGYWPNYNSLADHYRTRGMKDQAEQQWKVALGLAPDNPQIYQNLGGLYHSMGRYDDAVRCLRKSLELKPSATASSNLGTVFYTQRQYDDAVAQFEKAVELGPRNPVNWGNLADGCMQVRGKEKRAAEAYAKAVTLAEEQLMMNPANVSLRKSYAVYLAKSGRAREAQTEIERSLKEAPDNLYVRIAAVRVFAHIALKKRALELLKDYVAKGYPVQEILQEPDLAPLAEEARLVNRSK